MSLEQFVQSVRRTILPNGLTLLTREHRCGVVAINTWVKAGYFHEPDEVAGMAHLFEHMFFKGSKNFPGAEEIARHVSSLGGSTNAGTIYDSTNYYFVLPSEGWRKGVEIQADAILQPLFDPEELGKEAEVVIEESNRKFDNPPALATERMYATAFTTHRMKRWRIGSNEVLRDIRRDHLIAFFETLYRPENIIVTVVGDINHAEVIDEVERTFGRLPVGKLEKLRGPAEPPQREFRFAESRGDISQSYTVFGWHTPGEGSREEELDLLASLLGSGKYSRLYRRVVGPKGAASISASHSTFEDVGIFTIRASADDANLTEVERKIAAEVERVKRFGPTEFELRLARNGVEASFVFELEEVLGQAQTLSSYESRGGYERILEHVARLSAIGREEVRAAAADFLTMENNTVYRYRPTGAPHAEPSEVEELIRSAMSSELDAPEEETTPLELPPPRGARGLDALKRFILPNGIPVFVRETPATPTVAMSLLFRGGRYHETTANAGITQLMARAMRRGTESRSAEQIDLELEFLGTQIGITVDEDYFGFSLDVLNKHFPAALAVLEDVVHHPTFPEERLLLERSLQIASIRRSLDSGSERPFQLFFQTFYGSHPYALPDAGFIETVNSLTSDDLLGWYRETVVADHAVIVVVGDVASEELEPLLGQAFGSLHRSSSIRQATFDLSFANEPREVVEIRKRKQTAMVIGFPTVPPEHPDWIPLRLLQDVTSGLGGTFFAELRGRRALAYTVFAGDSSRREAGAFVAYIATEASKENAAREALIHEIRRLQHDGFTDEDVERAKSHAAGSTKIHLQTNSAFRGELAQNYLYNLGLDFTDRFLQRIAAVAPDDLRDVAKKYLCRDNYVVAILRGEEG